VIQTIQSGVPIARCDIVCEKTIDAINKYKKTSYRVAPTVFFEFHGTKAGVVEQAPGHLDRHAPEAAALANTDLGGGQPASGGGYVDFDSC